MCCFRLCTVNFHRMQSGLNLLLSLNLFYHHQLQEAFSWSPQSSITDVGDESPPKQDGILTEKRSAGTEEEFAEGGFGVWERREEKSEGHGVVVGGGRCHTAAVCLMLWKLIRVGDVGMDMARATRTRSEWWSCQRCHLFLAAERTSPFKKQ